MRESIVYKNIDTKYFKEKLLIWAQGFSHVAYYDSNKDKTSPGKFSYHNYDCIVAVDKISELYFYEKDNFKKLKNYYDKTKDWIFGFLTYDLKNDSQNLTSINPDKVNMPLLNFFQPKYLFFINETKIKVEFYSDYTPRVFINSIIKQIKNNTFGLNINENIDLKERVSKEEYIKNIDEIKKHIFAGDIYEMNYCIEFYSDEAVINPVEKYRNMNRLSPAPFSCFYKLYDKYLLCSSPERFLTKFEDTVVSQPIKGTIKHGKTPEEDELLKENLKNNQKEISENVMIVDLVRNDLSKTAQPGTVEVEELCGLYTFSHVHHLISTIKMKLRNDADFIDTINDCFPMGSMTGAPKLKAMEIIEKFENTKRGLYSGSVGYITPFGSFDFNVVIRSILFHRTNKYLSFMVGGAITAESDAEKEYEECLLKAESMKQALKNKF